MANGNRNPSTKSARKFREVEAGGEIIKLDVGESIEGDLVAARSVRVKGRDAMIYDIKSPDGKLYSMWGTAYLDQRMAAVEKGAYLRITFTEEQDVGQDSPMRVFKVEVAI